MPDRALMWLLSILGFLITLAVLSRTKEPRRSPSSTIAWLLSIVLIPWIGVPAYFAFGERKSKDSPRGKSKFSPEISSLGERGPDGEGGHPFSPTTGNGISLLDSGDQAFRALIALIENAKSSVDIATYVLSDDGTGNTVVAALVRKAGSGVKVRLLIDALGSIGLPSAMLEPLIASGGQCSFFMPILHPPFGGQANLRNHRKMAIADDSDAIIGGMNIAAEYMGPEADVRRWHDLSFKASGAMILDIHRVFESNWSFATKRRYELGTLAIMKSSNQNALIQVVPSGPDVDGDSLYDNVVSLFFTAKRSIWMATPYFIPDEMLIKSICIAARRGVDIRLVIPKASNHRIADIARRSYLRQMQESGARIYFFENGMMHGKAIVIDGSFAVVGSMNMDMRSFFLNYEIALYVYDKDVARNIENWLLRLMASSSIGVPTNNVISNAAEELVRLFAPLL